jgi:superfamily II DNA or RNA helicase
MQEFDSKSRLGATSSSLSSLNLDTEYRTGESDMVREFFEPCLARSNEYDRAVGYFRSSVFLVVGDAILDFVRRGGKIRFVCSPELGADDLAALEEGYEQREQILGPLLEAEVDELLRSDSTRAPTEMLATLVALGVLDVRIAVRPPSQGLYHEKIGAFRDEFGHVVSFKGSANETWHGWHDQGNLESIEVFCSWAKGSDAERVSRHQRYFERLWADRIAGIGVVPFPKAVREKLCSVAHDSVEHAVESVRAAAADASRPRIRRALSHQTEALANWRMAGRRGVLKHATGSGKTFTAMLALQEHVTQGMPALVLVPSTLLLEQWESELRAEIPSAALLLVGGGNNLWRRQGRLESFTSASKALGPRIVLATMQTAAKPEFRERVRTGKHLMLVADEVHQTGSSENANIFQIFTGPRLGLSATPERYGDPDGTRQIFDYFGSVVPPVVTLQDAVRAGRLVEYRYHPHPVSLTLEETERWQDFTDRIKREVARNGRDRSGNVILSERAKLLLIQRSRIAKKARRKIALAVEILREAFKEGDRWLVYCEDIEQLNQVVNALRAERIQASEYYSGMSGDERATLEWLCQFGGVVVSVRCLDEGVDIPSVSHALILASSQNPRQFIQRRGRVLRRSPGKQIAVIHDAIVVPPDISAEPEQAALARAELARAIEFAKSAINLDAGAELRDIAVDIGIDLEHDSHAGIEEQDAAASNVNTIAPSGADGS